VRAFEHLPRLRRRARAHREVGDCGFAPRERAVDRGQVGDDECEHAETDRGFEEPERDTWCARRTIESEREQARTARGERVAPAVVVEAVERDREAEEDERERDRGQREKRHRTVQRHHAVALLVGLRRPREQVEDASQRAEDEPREQHRRAARQHEGPDRGIEHEDRGQQSDDDEQDLTDARHRYSSPRGR
jgi:hypothetical protein